MSNVSQYVVMTSYSHIFSFTAIETYLIMTATSSVKLRLFVTIYGYLDFKLFNVHDLRDRLM